MQRRDVRKKKHPELQPYVPSDRFTYVKPKVVANVSNKEQVKKRTNNCITKHLKPKKADDTITKTTNSMSSTKSPETSSTTILTKENASGEGSTTTQRSSYTKSIPHEPQERLSDKVSESSPTKLSEISINELHYESAASEIIQQHLDSPTKPDTTEPKVRDSVISTTGNTTATSTLYDKSRNLESLCNELEADLIAEGLMKVDDRKRDVLNSAKNENHQNDM